MIKRLLTFNFVTTLVSVAILTIAAVVINITQVSVLLGVLIVFGTLSLVTQVVEVFAKPRKRKRERRWPLPPRPTELKRAKK